jgi:hypothetical protein
LVLEEPDFGMWMGDADPVWATSPHTTQVAFPTVALAPGRSLLRQVHQLGLADVGAHAEIDLVQAGSDLAAFYRLSQAALAGPKVQVFRARDHRHLPLSRRLNPITFFTRTCLAGVHEEFIRGDEEAHRAGRVAPMAYPPLQRSSESVTAWRGRHGPAEGGSP